MIKKLLIISILFLSCNRSFVPSETIIANNFSNFQIQCNVTTLERNETEGVNKALKKTFERLFYIGFPNTISNSPLIINKFNASQNDQYLNEFIDSKKYSPFISSISHQSRKNKIDRSNHFITNCQIVIDIASLRRYLENSGATRKFGY